MTRSLRQALVSVLLTAVALAPAVSRAHLRVSANPTPTQENAHFKWSNSCEVVPSRLAVSDHTFLIPVLRPAVAADHPPRLAFRPAPDVVRVVPSAVAPPALRAPPSIAL